MKNSSIIFCIIITVLLSACTKKTIYLTPEVHGKVYDSVSKKPLPRNHAKIGFDGLTGYEAPPIILKADGGFILPAVTKTYFFIRPNVKKYDFVLPQIYAGAENYQYKIIDYSPFYIKQVSEERSGYSYFNKINIGIIYLEIEK